MDASTIRRLDPNMALGIVNEKLRLECENLQDLAATYDLPVSELSAQLAQIGYYYDPISNQFKQR